MADEQDDPWASLRKASGNAPEAGEFAYSDEPPPAAKATAWQWVKLWFKIDFLGWLLKQVPLADKTLDSTYYLGITRKEKTVSNAVKKVVGREVQPQQSRIPIIVANRRIGIPGFLLGLMLIVIIIYFIRLIFGI